MKDIIPQLKSWLQSGKSFALARVVQTWGSSPRPVGSALVISADMEMAGSVSGGCVEGAVLKEAKQMSMSGNAKKLSYGVSDDEAWSVGLTCGGKIQIFLQQIHPDNEVWKTAVSMLDAGVSFSIINKLTEGEPAMTLVTGEGIITGSSLPDEVMGKIDSKSEVIVEGGTEYFVHSFPKRNEMLIIGAAHITTDLVQLAKYHDFETTVIDPRGIFADKLQFPVSPDHLIVKYPSEVLRADAIDGSTYAVILSHDPKIDDNALEILLRSKARYIGALGSRKTHENRIRRLLNLGFSEEEISRIESPVGVDIEAVGAKEIALSIMGGVIRAKNK